MSERSTVTRPTGRETAVEAQDANGTEKIQDTCIQRVDARPVIGFIGSKVYSDERWAPGARLKM